MNRTIILLGIVVTIVAFGGSMVAFQTNQITTSDLKYQGVYSKNLEEKHPSPILLSQLYGYEQDSLAAAQAKMPNVVIKEPRNLPAGIEQKLILTRSDEDRPRLVAFVLAPTSAKFSQDSTFEEVLDNHGIIAYYYLQNPGFNGTKWAKEYSDEFKDAVDEITVNGKSGITINGDPEKGQKSQVLFHDGETQFSVMSVAYQPDKLLKIVQSME